MEIENGGIENVTTPVTTEGTPAENDAGNSVDSGVNNGVDNTPTEPTFTKSQVVDLMKRRVERSHKAFFKRYGVEDLKGLDELFEKVNDYDSMKDEFGKLQITNSELNRKIAFIENNVNPDKYDDVIAYFKGKGIEFSAEELIKELATHPEWLKPSNVPATTTIKPIGAEQIKKPDVDKAKIASKIFGVDLN